MEDFRGNSKDNDASPSAVSPPRRQNSTTTTVAERVNRSLRLLSASYHNLAATLQVSGGASSLSPSHALRRYSLALRSRMAAIRRGQQEAAQRSLHRATTTTISGEFEDLALLGEIHEEIDSVLWEITGLEENARLAGADGGDNTLRSIRASLDVYLYLPPCTEPSGADADPNASSLTQAARNDYSPSLLPLKAPHKIELAPLALTLIGQGRSAADDHNCELKRVADVLEDLDAAAGLHAMALCHIEAAAEVEERTTTEEEESSSLPAPLLSQTQKARALLQMAANVLEPSVAATPGLGASVADRLVALRAFDLAADVEHSLGQLEYGRCFRSGAGGSMDHLIAAAERLNASLHLRGEAGLQHAFLVTTPEEGLLRAPAVPLNDFLESTKAELECEIADTLSLLGRVHLLLKEGDSEDHEEAALECLRRVIDFRVKLHGADSLQACAARYNAGIVTLCCAKKGRSPPHHTAVQETMETIGSFVCHPRLLQLAAGPDHDPRLVGVMADAVSALSDCAALLPPHCHSNSSLLPFTVIEDLVESINDSWHDEDAEAREEARISFEAAIAQQRSRRAAPRPRLLSSPPPGSRTGSQRPVGGPRRRLRELLEAAGAAGNGTTSAPGGSGDDAAEDGSGRYAPAA